MGVTDTTGTSFHGVVAGAPEPVVPQPVIKAPMTTRENQQRRMNGLEMILSIKNAALSGIPSSEASAS